MPGKPIYSVIRRWGSKRASYFSGDLVDAVVPFMGESISDGTLATFLKRKSLSVTRNLLIKSNCQCKIFECMVVVPILFGAEPGDKVDVDEPIAQVDTDKVGSEILLPITTELIPHYLQDGGKLQMSNFYQYLGFKVQIFRQE